MTFFLIFLAISGIFPIMSPSNINSPSIVVNPLGFTSVISSAPASINPINKTSDITMNLEINPLSNDNASISHSHSHSHNEQALSSQNEISPNEIAKPPDSRISMYLNYSVKDGDTISSIAQKQNIGSEYIVWNNIHVHDPDELTPGDKLLVPWVEGIIHAVRSDDTVSEIAQRYDATVEDILTFPANKLSDPDSLLRDTMIFVPGGRKITPASTIRPVPGVIPEQSGLWFWPAMGPITSYFSAWHPLGMDIGLLPNTPIVATKPGVVQFVGGDPWVSYGYYVIVDHGDGYESYYAHLSSWPERIQSGAWVEQGEVIGYSGNTGRSTGPHLHFEIRHNNQVIDPLAFLNQ